MHRKNDGPCLVLVSGEDRSEQFPSKRISFYSLYSNSFDENFIQLNDQVTDLQMNSKFIAVGLKNACKIELYDIETLDLYHTVDECWKSQEDHTYSPIFALGEHWLAFQSDMIVSSYDSTMNPHDLSDDEEIETVKNMTNRKEHRNHGDVNASWGKEDLMNVANVTMKEMFYSGSKIYQSFVNEKEYGSSIIMPKTQDQKSMPGIVQIIQLNSFETVSIFKAGSKNISKLCFDPSGLMLLTCPDGGQEVKIWPAYPVKNIKPLYILQRGTTLSSIKDVRFNDSSTLVAFTSQKGTTHIFPILPHGGEADASSHLEKRDFFILPTLIKTYAPQKLETIHTVSEITNDTFSGLSYLMPYPIKRSALSEKRERHKNDITAIVLHPSGMLIRYDLLLSRSPMRRTVLKAEKVLKYQWDLGRARTNKEQEYRKQRSGDQIEEGKGDPLSNTETVTYKMDENNHYLWNKKIFQVNQNQNGY